MPGQQPASDCRVPECQLAPFSLFLGHPDPPRYVLELTQEAIEAATDVFAAHELSGDADDWAVVALLATQAEMPDVATMLRSDQLTLEHMAAYDQGIWVNYFAVTAHESDVSALRRLGILLASLYRDPECLAQLIHDADPDLFDNTYALLDRFSA